MWVVTIARQPMLSSSSRIARPSAAPSAGIGARAQLVEQDQRALRAPGRGSAEIRRTCDEKVESDCSRLCSSPMSASTSSKTGSCDPSPAGMCRPAWAMTASSPTVLSATVLPPVFGPGDDQDPELDARGGRRSARLASRARSAGAASAPAGRRRGVSQAPDARLAGRRSASRPGSSRKIASSSGCRACRRTSRPSVVEVGGRHAGSRGCNRARAMDQVELGHDRRASPAATRPPARPGR